MNIIRDKYDEIYLLIQQSGYDCWCTRCGRDTCALPDVWCRTSECSEKVDHANHCHEYKTELCIPRNLKTVEHWLDCDCQG